MPDPPQQQRNRHRALKGCGLFTLLALAGLLLAYPRLLVLLGGPGQAASADWASELSPEAQALLARTWEGLDGDKALDVHMHLAGLGSGGSGCEVHPHMLSWKHPREHVRFDLFLAASGVNDQADADAQFVAQLDNLIATSGHGGRFCLLAFDHAYSPNGVLDLAHSEFYVPNEYVWQVAGQIGVRALPVMSVHPYRKDALDELERWAALGVRLIKWLPNSMGIDPASPACDAYYGKLVELDLALLTHTGEEQAVDAAERQKLGNPLRLRRPLERGVRVIAGHCATLGEDLDLDMPEGQRVTRPSFELFLRLMDEPQYEGLLFGDLSATTLVNRDRTHLRTLLERRDLHPRLLNGSDYPVPAINVLIHPGRLADAGLLAEADVEPLREIFAAHPLAFDLALKRCLRDPASGLGFAPSVFGAPDVFGF